MKLTSAQLKEFDENGYIIVENCFSADEMAVLRSEAEGIYKTKRKEVWFEKSGAPRTAFAAHTYNEAFGILGRHPRLISPLEEAALNAELRRRVPGLSWSARVAETLRRWARGSLGGHTQRI